MGLYENIEGDARSALKKGDKVRVSALRMVLSAFKLFEIDNNVKKIAEPDMIKIIQKEIKQHKDSIEQFSKGARLDLVERETEELRVLESYMPKQLTEKELVDIIKKAIEETDALTKLDSGKVMKVVMENVRGRADGKLVNQLVMGLLK